MRLVTHATIAVGLAVAALSMAAPAAAHDHRHGWHGQGWRQGHHHGHDRFFSLARARPLVIERPVMVERPVLYRAPALYYPPPPPSLNINIPLR